MAFYAQLQSFQYLHKTLNQKGPFLSYATLMSSVPVLGAEQFPCGVMFNRFLAEDGQTGSNWFLLILQTAKPSIKKIYKFYCPLDFQSIGPLSICLFVCVHF